MLTTKQLLSLTVKEIVDIILSAEDVNDGITVNINDNSVMIPESSKHSRYYIRKIDDTWYRCNGINVREYYRPINKCKYILYKGEGWQLRADMGLPKRLEILDANDISRSTIVATYAIEELLSVYDVEELTLLLCDSRYELGNVLIESLDVGNDSILNIRTNTNIYSIGYISGNYLCRYRAIGNDPEFDELDVSWTVPARYKIDNHMW